jgi:DNA-binding IscR family transcriptional regulator
VDEAACQLRRVFAQVFWSYLVLIDSLTLADLVARPGTGESSDAAQQIGL